MASRLGPARVYPRIGDDLYLGAFPHHGGIFHPRLVMSDRNVAVLSSNITATMYCKQMSGMSRLLTVLASSLRSARPPFAHRRR